MRRYRVRVTQVWPCLVVVAMLGCSQDVLDLPTCTYRPILDKELVAIAVGSTAVIHGRLTHFGKCKEPDANPARVAWSSSNPDVAGFGETTDTSETLYARAVGSTVIRLSSLETMLTDSVTMVVLPQ